MTEEQLNEALKEIRENMTPDEVFTTDQLISWVRDHLEPYHIYSLKALKSTIDDLKAEII